MALRAGGDRVTTARLRADASQFIREIAKAAAAAKALDRTLANSGGAFRRDLDESTDSVTRFKKELQDLNRTPVGSQGFGDAFIRMGHDVDVLDGKLADLDFDVFDDAADSVRHTNDELSLFGFRLGSTNNRLEAMSQAIIAIAPAASPALAAAGAGVVALGGQLTFAATGAGIAALAFAGVGDALTALNKVALDPSTANLEKLRLAMDQLGPAGQDFVVFLQESRGELERLQNLAGAGFLPGLQEGMESLIEQMPQLEAVISSVSGTLGDLAAEAGEGFGSEKWREFFTYLATDANAILTDMGHTIGLFVEGLASMLVAFGPLTKDFSAGLAGMAKSFAEWAAGLQENRGFQTFIDYVRDVTPQLLDTLGALIIMLVDLGKAMSGIGPVALKSLEVLANALSLFLEAPFAPALLGLASALGAVATILRVSSWTGFATLLNVLRTIPVAAGAAAASMSKFGTAMSSASGRSAQQAAAMASLKANWLGAAGAAGILVGALTDVDDNLGVTNTLMLTSAGALLGPWGAAVGFAAGATLDLAAANDDAVASMERLDQLAAESPGSISSRAAEMERLSKATEDAVGRTEGWMGVLTGASWSDKTPFVTIGSFLKEDADDAEAALAKQEAALNAMKEALSGLANETSGGPLTDYTNDLAKLDEIATQAQPVLDHMGITLNDMQGLWTLGGSVRQQFIADFKEARAEMDSLAGRGKAVATALGDMDNEMLSTASSASALSTALDSLVTPFLTLVGARDAFAAGLDDLNSALAKNDKSLRGQTDAARQNREVITGLVQAQIDMINAQAEAGKGSQFLANSLSESRDAILDAGVAAGLSRKELEAFLSAAGLTPKLIRTVFEAQGITKAENDARNLSDAYNKLPRSVRVAVREEGGVLSAEVIKRLRKQIDLTPKQVRVLMGVKDNASVKIDGVRAKVKNLGKEKSTPKIELDRGAFIKGVDQARATLKQLNDEDSIPKLDVDATAAQDKIKTTNAMLSHYDGQKGVATADVNDEPAKLAIAAVIRGLENIDGRTATSTIYVNTVESTRTRASGGPAFGVVRGPGGPTSDTAGLFALSNGEFVQQTAAARHYGYDAMYAINDMRADRNALRSAIGLATGGLAGLAGIQLPGLAGGGQPPRKRGDRLTRGDVFDKTLRTPTLDLRDVARALADMRDEARDVVVAERAMRKEREKSKDIAQQVREAERGNGEASKELLKRQREQAKDLADAEKELSKQRGELSEATAKLRDKERELLAQAQAVSDAITSQGAIFGGNGTSVTAQGILSKLRSSVKDARQFREDIAILRGRGLDEDIITQLEQQGSTPEGVQAVHNLAESSKRMLKRINAEQQKLERIGASVGAWSTGAGGGGKFGGMLAISYGDIHTTDFEDFNRKNVRNIRRAVRRARQP